MADQDRLFELQRVQQLVVAEDEIPQPVELIDLIGRARRRAGMLRRVHGEVAREDVEKRIPRESPRAVKEHEGRTAALRHHAQMNPLLPDGDGAFLRHAPPAATAAVDAGTRAPRSFSGHQ